MSSSRTVDGWVTKTKSKEQIARDAQKAKNARKARKPKQTKPVDEGDYEEEDFVVDDESYVSVDDSDDDAFDSNLEDEDEEEDHELVLHDDDDDDDESDTGIDREVLPTSKRRGASSVRTINKDGDASSSSDDDEEGDSFLPTGKPRPSAPSRLLKAKADAAMNGIRRPSLTKTLSKTKKRTSTVDSLALLKYPPATKKHKATNPSFRLNKDTDDDEELTSPMYTPNKATKSRPQQRQQPNKHYKEVFSSDEENESKSCNRKPNDDASRYFDKQKTIVLDDDSDNDSLVAVAAAPTRKTTVLEDTPEPTYSKTKSKKKTFSIHESSDEDNDDGFDEDTRVAMRISLQETKKTKLKSKIDAVEEDDANNVEMVFLDDSSDDDGDQGDEYYDQEKETATNVLRSAEQLSAHVVRAMSSWFGKNGQVQGIIVDGAIALGDTVGENESEETSATSSRRNSNHSKNNTHEWISKSVMKKAIPNVTLSGYQLVGVNWMALLNGMTCQVGSKGIKNVNGVLADEMGLVSIVVFDSYWCMCMLRELWDCIVVHNEMLMLLLALFQTTGENRANHFLPCLAAIPQAIQERNRCGGRFRRRQQPTRSGRLFRFLFETPPDRRAGFHASQLDERIRKVLSRHARYQIPRNHARAGSHERRSTGTPSQESQPIRFAPHQARCDCCTGVVLSKGKLPGSKIPQ